VPGRTATILTLFLTCGLLLPISAFAHKVSKRVAGFFDSAKMFAGGPPEDVPTEDAK
jgi:hypothetical protein